MDDREKNANAGTNEVPGALSTNPPPNPRGREHTDESGTGMA
jgi:hypothetical protein